VNSSLHNAYWRLLALLLVAGCGQNSAAVPPVTSTGGTSSLAREIPVTLNLGASSRLSQKIQHVVIILQENRTTNNLFNGFPGANTVKSGKNSRGHLVPLQPQSLTAPYDISHKHDSFLTEYDSGRMDGFNLVKSGCDKKRHKRCPPRNVRAYGYVPEQEVKPYFTMAKRYVLASNMFQTNEGPSFPAHQYILSGTSTISDGNPLRAAENAWARRSRWAGGCDSPKHAQVVLIDTLGNENQSAYPCFDRNSIPELMEGKSLSWSYYQDRVGPGIWNGPDAILPLYKSREFSKSVVAPPSKVLTDISGGNLASVIWITPTPRESDHARVTDGSGPSWVAAVVNAIGKSKYWNNTAIFITWDDWGGWYDPVPPPQYNSYELGFRVPLIVISAYAKTNYISTNQHEFASILKFTEETFGLPSLGTTDTRADDLSDCFDFTKGPRKFQKIPAPLGADYFLRQATSDQLPDDDF
jgi:phospholipase C